VAVGVFLARSVNMRGCSTIINTQYDMRDCSGVFNTQDGMRGCSSVHPSFSAENTVTPHVGTLVKYAGSMCLV
jgi:uncharacterized protein YceK